MLNLIQKKLQDRMVSLSALQIHMWLLEIERVLTKAMHFLSLRAPRIDTKV